MLLVLLLGSFVSPGGEVRRHGEGEASKTHAEGHAAVCPAQPEPIGFPTISSWYSLSSLLSGRLLACGVLEGSQKEDEVYDTS